MESIVEGLIKGKAEKISELPYLMVNDRISLLELPNYQFQPFANLPIHQMIQRMAKIQPDHTAVIWHGKTTTYEQLMNQAARIAAGLVAAGAEKRRTHRSCICQNAGTVFGDAGYSDGGGRVRSDAGFTSAEKNLLYGGNCRSTEDSVRQKKAEK